MSTLRGEVWRIIAKGNSNGSTTTEIVSDVFAVIKREFPQIVDDPRIK